MYGKPLAYTVKIKDVQPIIGADKIELATVMDYTVVVKKGEFKPGDLGIYIEIDSVLPDGLTPDLAEKLKTLQKGTTIDGVELTEDERESAIQTILAESKWPQFEFLRPKKFKIKSMKLSKFGIISQGILFTPALLNIDSTKEGEDWTERIGVKEIVEDEEEAGLVSSSKPDSWLVKKMMRYAWFRELRKRLRGTKINSNWDPSYPPKSDEENVQKLFSKMQEKYPGEEWIVTEKLEGQNISVFNTVIKKLFRSIRDIGVCSRTRRVVKSHESGSPFWETVENTGVGDIVRKLSGDYWIRGEHVGPGIQGNIYGLKSRKICVFDVYEKAPGTKTYQKLDFDTMMQFCKANGLETVPVIDEHFKLPATVTELLEYSDKPTVFCNNGHKREGVVLRLRKDYNVSFKVKNPFYTI